LAYEKGGFKASIADAGWVGDLAREKRIPKEGIDWT